MGLFKADLYRALGLGFVLGCAALIAVLGSPFSHKSLAEQVIPSATAATAAPDLPDQTLVTPDQTVARL
jgi:hypothetical protein